MNLLSVDWDYFVRTAGDDPDWRTHPTWTLHEFTDSARLPDFELEMWYVRMAHCHLSGAPLPRLLNVQGFWKRFDIAGDATLYYADSHRHAYDPVVREGITCVWNYDAHHDCGYAGDLWPVTLGDPHSCEDWLAYYGVNGADVHIRYPRWKSPYAQTPDFKDVDARGAHEDAPSIQFQRVYVCRSGGWTPPTMDGDFLRFLRECPVGEGHRARVGPLPHRPWDAQRVDDLIDEAACSA